MSYEMREDAVVDLIETTDIGGTNVTSDWLPMAEFQRIHAVVQIGTWDAGDDLDTCKFEQADDSAGGGTVKDLTTSGSGKDYDTDNPVDADGDQVILSARAEDLDSQNGFAWVRLKLAETGNSGPDFVSAAIIRYHATYKHDHQQAAPVTGSKVYVRPS